MAKGSTLKDDAEKQRENDSKGRSERRNRRRASKVMV